MDFKCLQFLLGRMVDNGRKIACLATDGLRSIVVGFELKVIGVHRKQEHDVMVSGGDEIAQSSSALDRQTFLRDHTRYDSLACRLQNDAVGCDGRDSRRLYGRSVIEETWDVEKGLSGPTLPPCRRTV